MIRIVWNPKNMIRIVWNPKNNPKNKKAVITGMFISSGEVSLVVKFQKTLFIIS